MADLLDKARRSKLSQPPTENRASGLAAADRQEPPPKSFRLGAEGEENLKKITAAVNALSHRRLREPDIIRALLYLGTQLKPERILKAYKDSL